MAGIRRSIDEVLADARSRLRRVGPHGAAAAQAAGALLIDIRPVEVRRRDGEVPGALIVDRNVLEWRLDPTSPHRLPAISGHEQTIVVLCTEGYASSLAAASLQDLGLHPRDRPRWWFRGLGCRGAASATLAR